MIINLFVSFVSFNLFNYTTQPMGAIIPPVGQNVQTVQIDKKSLKKAVINWWNNEVATIEQSIDEKNASVVVLNFYEELATVQTSLKSTQAIRDVFYTWAQEQAEFLTVQMADAFINEMSANFNQFINGQTFNLLWNMDKKRHKKLTYTERERILARELPIAAILRKHSLE